MSREENLEGDLEVKLGDDCKGRLPKGALEVMLKEYDHLREEVKERLKIAFSHVAYAGAIAAFTLSTSCKIWIDFENKGQKFTISNTSIMTNYDTTTLIAVGIPLSLFVIGEILLWQIVWVNMRWVQHCGAHIRSIEQRVNNHFNCEVLGWEHYSSIVQKSMFLLVPKKPKSWTCQHYSSHRNALTGSCNCLSSNS